jgi:hypothetical protein
MSRREQWFLVLLFLVGGCFMSVALIRLDWILHQSKSWPEVEGRVVSVERRGHDRGLTYTYQYTYTADGKTESSTNIELGPDAGYYPLKEGDRVLVRHSPGPNPYAFLFKTDLKTLMLFHVIGYGWMIAGGFGLFALMRRTEK